MAVDVETCSLVSSHGTRRSAARKALLFFFFFFWEVFSLAPLRHPPVHPPAAYLSSSGASVHR